MSIGAALAFAREIGATALLVYALIDEQPGHTKRELLDILPLSEPTLQRALKILRDKRLIDPTTDLGKPNHYYILRVCQNDPTPNLTLPQNDPTPNLMTLPQILPTPRGVKNTGVLPDGSKAEQPNGEGVSPDTTRHIYMNLKKKRSTTKENPSSGKSSRKEESIARSSKSPKPWSALTKAMHEATPKDIRPPRCHYAKHSVDAQTLYQDGWTTEQVAAYVEYAYATDPYIQGKNGKKRFPIYMSYILENIKAEWPAVQRWLANKQPEEPHEPVEVELPSYLTL